jgi:predicted nucleic acid-binding protein
LAKNSRIAIIDSSTLLNLAHLELESKIGLFFDRVLVPRAVHEEVCRKHKFRYRMKKLYSTATYARCIVADPVSVQLLAIQLDEGEAEALVQAQETGATYFIGDDADARSIGERRGLLAVGTARILARLELENHVDNARTLINRLRKERKFRISEDIVASAIRLANEPI